MSNPSNPSSSTSSGTNSSKPIATGIAFSRQVVRQKTEIERARPQVTKAQRETMNEKELLNLTKEATLGFQTKLTMIAYDKIGTDADSDMFESNEEIENFVTSFQHHCIRFDMIELLIKFPVLDLSPQVSDEARHDEGRTIDLLDKWDQIGASKKISLKTIATTITWIKQYCTSDSEPYLDDIDWQHRFLMNCMDSTLSDTVLSIFRNDYQVSTHGGPLTFAIMIDKCINVSPEAIKSLKSNIENYKLSNVAGENVELSCRRLRFGLKRLENNQALPHDITSTLLSVLKTSSVPQFTEWITHWENALLFIEHKDYPTYPTILAKAQDRYTSLCLTGAWTGVNKESSAFIGNDNANSSSSSGANAPHKPPSSIEWSPPTAKDKVCLNPERFERVIKGKLMKYCLRCFRRGTNEKGRWNTTHHTDGHLSYNDRQAKDSSKDTNSKQQPSPTPTANLASTPVTKEVSFKDSLLGAASGTSN